MSSSAIPRPCFTSFAIAAALSLLSLASLYVWRGVPTDGRGAAQANGRLFGAAAIAGGVVGSRLRRSPIRWPLWKTVVWVMAVFIFVHGLAAAGRGAGSA